MTAIACQAHIGNTRRCGAPLRLSCDPFGRVSSTCDRCERRARGLCRECPNATPEPLVRGKRPWFCDACTKRKAKLRDLARVIHYPEYQRRLLALKTRHEKMKQDPDYLARRLETSRRYEANKRARLHRQFAPMTALLMVNS